MRIEYKGKRYTVDKYDFSKGVFDLTNGEKIREREITSFILNNEDYKKLKDFKVKEAKKEETIEE